METERQKFYKHKIKRILTKDDASSVIDENDKSTVTLLGSTSYHKQVNDFSIMNSSNTDQQSETLLDDKVEPNFHAITVNEEGEELFPKDADDKIIASPVDYVDTYKAMEKLVEQGLTRSIGLSNFNKRQIERVLEVATIKPAMLQIEVHPYLNQQPLIDFCKLHDIAITAYSPLGSPDRPWAKPGDPQLLDDPRIKTISDKYGKTVAQVLIRYAIDRGIVVIPKSVTKSRIIQNFNVFDFQLTLDDIKEIASLECKGRVCMMGDTYHPDYPFHDEY